MRRGIPAALAALLVASAARAGFAREASGALHVSVTVRRESTRVETSGRTLAIDGRAFTLDSARGSRTPQAPGEPRVSWTTEWDGYRRVTIAF